MTILIWFLMTTYLCGIWFFLLHHKKRWKTLEGYDFVSIFLDCFIAIIWPLALYIRGMQELVKLI